MFVRKDAAFNGSTAESLLFLFIHMTYDTAIGQAYEVKDMDDFLAHGYLLGNLNDCIFEAEIGRVDKAVGIGDVAEDAVGRLKVL